LGLNDAKKAQQCVAMQQTRCCQHASYQGDKTLELKHAQQGVSAMCGWAPRCGS
jgi:hypothetical protein